MAESIPLFPLGTVLFPGTPLHLYIFEPRYKLMVERCIQESQRFGVVLIRRGIEALGPLAEPFEVGCSAQIAHVQKLENGEMNIVALGVERFRILSLDVNDDAYLDALVEPYPLEIHSLAQGWDDAQKLRQQVKIYLRRLVDATGGEVNLEPIPEDPLSLAYLAASMVQIPPLEKQRLLELNRIDSLLESLLKAFRLEQPLLKFLLERKDEEDGEVFSRN